MSYHADKRSQHLTKSGRVTVEDDIVYDVTMELEGPYMKLHAQYNSDATALNYVFPEQADGTGPVKNEYGGVIIYIGTPPRPEETDLEDCLAYLREYDLDDI